MMIVIIATIFAIGFGMRACRVADESEEAMESSAHVIPPQEVVRP